MTWGPDGWLYGAQGSTVTARIRGSEFQQGDLALSSPRPTVRALRRRGRQHLGPRLRPRPATPSAAATARTSRSTWSRAAITSRASPSTARCTTRTPTAISARSPTAGPSTGGHVTPGGIIYKGDAFPPRSAARSSAATCSPTPSTGTSSSRDGSTFAGRHGGTLIDARDRWFRPIDLLAGPDAAVYVVDWYDKRAAHLDPRDTWDRTNGRIYRVVYGERRKVAAVRPVETHLAPSWSRSGPAPTTGSPPRPAASSPSVATRRSCPS